MTEPTAKSDLQMNLPDMDERNARFNVIANGPLEITGFFRIADSSGRIIEKEGPVFLCRCGESKNKPYCDGSHKRNGFSE